MQLAELEIEGVRRLPRLAWNLRGQRLIFLTGAAGSGKSSVLRAIAGAKEASAPYGSGAVRVERFAGQGSPAKIRMALALTEEEAAAAQLDRAAIDIECALGDGKKVGALTLREKAALRDASGKIGRLVLLDELRLPPHPTLNAEEDARRAVAEEGDSKMLGVHALVGDAHRGADRAAVDALLAALGSGLRLTGTTTRSGVREPALAVPGVDGSVPLSRLSTTERAAALLALAFVALRPRDSIVLWDAPELALGAGAARALAGLLEHDKSNQFVVATGSASLVSAFPQAVAAKLEPAGGGASP